jgi:hypothetical protein
MIPKGFFIKRFFGDSSSVLVKYKKLYNGNKIDLLPKIKNKKLCCWIHFQGIV